VGAREPEVKTRGDQIFSADSVGRRMLLQR
jgi:hypothetical protein